MPPCCNNFDTKAIHPISDWPASPPRCVIIDVLAKHIIHCLSQVRDALIYRSAAVSPNLMQAFDCRQRRADDTRFVTQLRGNDIRIYRQQRQEFLVFLADTAANDYQLGPEVIAHA